MKMDDPEVVLDFILGGKSIFTLVSVKTGDRRTYKVSESNDINLHFVHLRTGGEALDPDPWTYIGVIRDGARFTLTAKSKLNADSPAVGGMMWLMTQLSAGQLPEDRVEFWHEGQCAACAGRLTVPLSIKRGFGPHCWEVRKRRALDR